LSINLSLVAVFRYWCGRADRPAVPQFAATLSAAVMISLVISLTTTPMMCAWLLKPAARQTARPHRANREAAEAAAAQLRGRAGLGAVGQAARQC
jgi:multidrug efflux pump